LALPTTTTSHIDDTQEKDFPMDTSYAATLLPEARLQALDAELASMEVILNLLRYAEGDGRGILPWLERVSPRLCRQVCAALELFGSELPEDIDADEVRAVIEAEFRVMCLLHAQRERLARVLALTDEVAGAVGSDLMQLAMQLHDALVDAGHGDSITALSDGRSRRGPA
jgi:hypothetical protein